MSPLVRSYLFIILNPNLTYLPDVLVFRYLEYAQDIICEFLKSGSVTEVLFVPYALRDQVGDR